MYSPLSLAPTVGDLRTHSRYEGGLQLYERHLYRRLILTIHASQFEYEDSRNEKLIALIAIAVTLTACSESETIPAPAAVDPAAATAPAAPAARSATSAAPATSVAATTTGSADIPEECQDYLDKVNACVSKQHGASGDAIKASMEQTEAAWASMGVDKQRSPPLARQ